MKLSRQLPEVEAALDMVLDKRLVDDRVRAQFEELVGKIDLKVTLRRLALGGFDTFEDYEKYGDLYVEVSPPRAAKTR